MQQTDIIVYNIRLCIVEYTFVILDVEQVLPVVSTRGTKGVAPRVYFFGNTT